jgi:hypothetical protein
MTNALMCTTLDIIGFFIGMDHSVGAARTVASSDKNFLIQV